jgi:hypothetical protein
MDERINRPFPRLRDLPEEERKRFSAWLRGSACPWIEGLPREEQDAYYPWDLDRWKHLLAKAKTKRLQT